MSARIPPRQGMRAAGALILALAAGLGAAAQAEQAPVEPGPGKLPQCTRDYVQSVKQMLEATEKLRTAGPEAVGRICSMIEKGSAFFGGRLPDALRQELRSLLGVDIDLDQLQTQCRAGQDSLERELAASLQRMRAELVRCDDTI